MSNLIGNLYTLACKLVSMYTTCHTTCRIVDVVFVESKELIRNVVFEKLIRANLPCNLNSVLLNSKKKYVA